MDIDPQRKTMFSIDFFKKKFYHPWYIHLKYKGTDVTAGAPAPVLWF